MAGCEHLFVYGTLMSSASDGMGIEARARLHREARRIGSAVAPGRLYDLGRYPGLVADKAADTVVHGEVVRLHDPERSLVWLDAYESIDPRPGAANEYVRTLAMVTLDNGARTEAWLYRFILDVQGFPRIPSGRRSDRPID